MPKRMCKPPKPKPSINVCAAAGSANVDIPSTTNKAPMRATSREIVALVTVLAESTAQIGRAHV